MKSVKLRATEPAVVQGRCQQDTGRPGPGQCGQIVNLAHAARRIQATGGIQALQLRQPGQIGAGIHADARQCHDDHLRRPAFGVLQQRGRTEKIVPPEIQRQHTLRRPCVAFRKNRQALAAQHRPSPTRRLPGFGRRRIGKAAIHPEFEIRMQSLQPLHYTSVIALSQDGVQVGDIDPPERIQCKQPRHHRLGTAGTAQGRFQRPVFVAPAAKSTHNLSVHQVEYGDER
ncbi:MAG: hypothetical protein ABT23_00680 [Thiobacillus sp. SCN 63-57]|nr:MAG: hypothetical protein ABT23_00680 [Thiobacillus sp. SCN 63-57]